MSAGGTRIHPTAIVESGAQLGADVTIGPFCIVASQAVIGDRVELASHVVIEGATTLGEDCKVHHHAVLGGAPQNAKHKGGRTTLAIGRNCTIREFVTMHRGTDTSTGETTVGENGNFLAYTHIAHDCAVGRNVTMANVATLGGHCQIGDFVGIGGLSAVHQFTRVGHHAFIGGMTGVTGDVIPYGMVKGDTAILRGLNVVGMRRAGLSKSDVHTLRLALHTIFDRAQPVAQNLARARDSFGNAPIVMDVIEFLSQRGHRQFTVPPLDTGWASSDGDDA